MLTAWYKLYIIYHYWRGFYMFSSKHYTYLPISTKILLDEFNINKHFGVFARLNSWSLPGTWWSSFVSAVIIIIVHYHWCKFSICSYIHVYLLCVFQQEEIAQQFLLPERQAKVNQLLRAMVHVDNAPPSSSVTSTTTDEEETRYCICRSTDCSRFMM